LQNPDYLKFFRKYFESKSSKDLETGCTCLHFMFKRKDSIITFFANNLDILKAWLSCARSTDDHLKKAFIVALKELLKVPKDLQMKESLNEIVRRLFSNLTTPAKFPDLSPEN
jgi:hypothetical protein